MNMNTTWLGLTLRNPLVVSPSPLCDSLDNLRRMEDAGAGAIVLHSLFEEQINAESRELDSALRRGSESYSEVMSYFPDPGELSLGVDSYLELLRAASESLEIPVIASLNGATPGGWTRYAKMLEDAGASALAAPGVLPDARAPALQATLVIALAVVFARIFFSDWAARRFVRRGHVARATRFSRESPDTLLRAMGAVDHGGGHAYPHGWAIALRAIASPDAALDRLIERLRTRTGQTVVARKKVMFTLKRLLAERKVIGILGDGGMDQVVQLL